VDRTSLARTYWIGVSGFILEKKKGGNGYPSLRKSLVVAIGIRDSTRVNGDHGSGEKTKDK